MWIMTQYGWRKIQSTLSPNTIEATRIVKHGYHAADTPSQWVELAALVLPEKYSR